MIRPLLLRRNSGFLRLTILTIVSILLLTGQRAEAFALKISVSSGAEITAALPAVRDTVRDDILDRVEVEASFPGGNEAWAAYISQRIVADFNKFTKKDYGTCIIRFVVSKNGKVTDVKAETMRNSRLAKTAIKAIKDGPDWVPAQQDGRFVNAYRIQPVTLTDPNAKPVEPVDPEKIYTDPEKPAEFPGGATQWQRFVEGVIRKNVDEFSSRDAGTCELTFIVDEKGNLSDIRATRMEGSKLAKAMIEALEAGPRWIPAEVRKQRVKSQRSLPVTLRL